MMIIHSFVNRINGIALLHTTIFHYSEYKSSHTVIATILYIT
jgi:hypothetical protein